jgi:AcrR family transcriptional regulator
MNTHSPATRHERRRLRTRELLIQTTLQLVLEKGYEAISIQDITDRADLGRGTFYIHFKEKEEVVWTAFQDLFEDLEREAHQQLDRHMPQVEYYGLLNIYRHAETNRDLYRLMFGGKGSAELTIRAQDFLAKVFLYDIYNNPEPAESNFHLPEEFEAQMLAGIISRLLFWWLETPNNYSAEQMAAMTYMALYRKNPPALEVDPRRFDDDPAERADRKSQSE